MKLFISIGLMVLYNNIFKQDKINKFSAIENFDIYPLNI